jgi:hypothetical protein
MTNRRGFLEAIFAVAAAPAIVRAESLMKIYVPSQEITYETLAYRQAAAMGRAMQQTQTQVTYGLHTYTYSDGSTLLTRQQMINQLLPELNKLFNIEHSKYMENLI